MADERGATLAEYALLLGLLALATVGVVTSLGQRSSSRFAESAARIDAEPTGTETDPSAPPPPATSPSTSTTAPIATTTTTVPPDAGLPETSGFGSAALDSSWDGWRARTDLVVRDEHGGAVPQADATVRIWRYERTSSSWSWRYRLVAVVTGPDGVVEVSTLTFPHSGVGSVDRVIFTLYDVDDVRWDGVQGNLQVDP